MYPQTSFIFVRLVPFIGHFLGITKSMKIQIYSVEGNLAGNNYIVIDSKSRARYEMCKNNFLSSFAFDKAVRRLGSILCLIQLEFKIWNEHALHNFIGNNLSVKTEQILHAPLSTTMSAGVVPSWKFQLEIRCSWKYFISNRAKALVQLEIFRVQLEIFWIQLEIFLIQLEI